MLALSLIALGLLSRQALLIGTPLFALLGGALGLLVVLGTVFAITKLGVLSGLLLVILAELLGAALIDSFGLLGRPRLPLDLARLGGIGLVLMGALLTLRKAG
jgi:transporter family-2 protein